MVRSYYDSLVIIGDKHHVQQVTDVPISNINNNNSSKTPRLNQKFLPYYVVLYMTTDFFMPTYINFRYKQNFLIVKSYHV